MTAAPQAELGVFGGSGLYALLDDGEEVEVDTPYGPPSAPVRVGDVGGRRVAFLPRHGVGHEHPPHRVPYRANVWALHSLGVRQVVAPCAVGSLRADLGPATFVVPDQLVDRTSGRDGTFFDGPTTYHAALADPYCDHLRAEALAACRAEGVTVEDGGTVTVVSGPRFSTRAESRWFASMGTDLLNMTQAPGGGALPGGRALLRGDRARHRLRRRPRRHRPAPGDPGRGVRPVRRHDPRAAADPAAPPLRRRPRLRPGGRARLLTRRPLPSGPAGR